MTHPHETKRSTPQIIGDPRVRSAIAKFGKGGVSARSIALALRSATFGPAHKDKPIGINPPPGKGVPLAPVIGRPVGPGIPLNPFKDALEKRKKQGRSSNDPTRLRAGAQAFHIRSNF